MERSCQTLAGAHDCVEEWPEKVIFPIHPNFFRPSRQGANNQSRHRQRENEKEHHVVCMVVSLRSVQSKWWSIDTEFLFHLNYKLFKAYYFVSFVAIVTSPACLLYTKQMLFFLFGNNCIWSITFTSLSWFCIFHSMPASTWYKKLQFSLDKINSPVSLIFHLSFFFFRWKYTWESIAHEQTYTKQNTTTTDRIWNKPKNERGDVLFSTYSLSFPLLSFHIFFRIRKEKPPKNFSF